MGSCNDYRKRMKDLIKKVRSQGYRVTRTGKSHFRFECPQGLYFAPSTSKCWGTFKKVVRELRKRGLEVQ